MMKFPHALVLAVVLAGCPGPSSLDGGLDGRDGGTQDAFDSGFVSVLPGIEAQGHAVVPSGADVFVVGNGSSDGGAASLLVARFKPDRSLDTTWAGTGFTLVNAIDGVPPLTSDTGYAALVDGTSLFVCGTAQALQVPGAGLKVMLAKFLGDGSLDTTFGNTGMTNGLRIDAFGTNTAASCTAVLKQPDGKILVGGDVQSNFFVTRYLPNGTADVSFSKTPGTGFGAVWGTTGRAEKTRSMVLEPGGKIVVFGGDSMSAARILSDGQLDLTFGTSGYVSSPGADGVALWREADGSYLAVGYASLGVDAGRNHLAVRFLKLSASGQPDFTFGTDGYRQVLLPSDDVGLSTIRGAARLADGSFVLYVTGLIKTYLVRFNADFTLDNTSLADGGLQPTSVKLPLFQPAFVLGSHVTVTEGNRVWVTDINLVTIEPRGPTQKNFFDLITQTF
jgi:uncharacterized delta-60 repeat protein